MKAFLSPWLYRIRGVEIAKGFEESSQHKETKLHFRIISMSLGDRVDSAESINDFNCHAFNFSNLLIS